MDMPAFLTSIEKSLTCSTLGIFIPYFQSFIMLEVVPADIPAI